MSDIDIISSYAQEVQQAWRTGHAKEHGYRPALERLMSAFNDSIAINDPKRSDYGNPDFVFLKRSHQNVILGYAEAKDIDIDLDRTETSSQMHRYAGYDNLFLTNYLEFRFFKNGTKYQTITVGTLRDGQLVFNEQEFLHLQRELQAFLEQPPESIKSGKRLAQIMGAKARRLRDNVSIYLGESSERNKELESIYKMMQKLLVHDLTTEKFADMYSQTLVYGLFVARYNDDTPENFTRGEARDLVPASNPFLREFFDHIVGPRFDTRLAYIVDELCEVFSVSDVQDIVHKHLKVIDLITDGKDPIIHFYEDFLKEYDPAERKKMGAYYTPVPVVRFIIREVDEVLKRDFGLEKGLADTSKIKKKVDLGQEVIVRKNIYAVKTKEVDQDFYRVQVLDPAVGTATFLNEIIKHVYGTFKGQEGRWPAYAVQDLLPRLYGFELMMAPYTIAHLKLGMTLAETGVTDFGQRLGVYLTNTLEEGIRLQQDLFNFGLAEVVSHEADEAAKIKSERPIMVIIGNPPYSGESSNKTAYASALVNKYKVEPGGQVKLQERNPKWINDDYVKFIAFAESMIEKNGDGILAMITNNGYLDNPTFRGMRWHLAKTFDKIFILDLHGSTKKKETAHDGTKDENVFDIQQGVAIIVAAKFTRSAKSAEVYHADMYGKRVAKFERLGADIEWVKTDLDNKFYNFIPTTDPALKRRYDRFIPLQDLFIQNTLGFQTHRDAFAIADTPQEITRRFNEMTSDVPDNILHEKYGIGDNRDWQLKSARERARQQSEAEYDALLQKCAYRPFDTKYTYLDEVFSDYPRSLFKKHLSNKENLVLGVGRQGLAIGNVQWCLVTVSRYAMDANIFRRGGVNAYPLYLYHDDDTRTPNFQIDTLKKLLVNVKQHVEPEEVIDFLYSILHSPSYRDLYHEYLKSDFPRIPTPKSGAEFKRLVALGKELRELHLMSSPLLSETSTTYPIAGNNAVEKVAYEKGGVWINQDQYFGNVPQVAWNFCIGGYQPAQKWLKDRKGRELTNQEIEQYQRIVTALDKTIEIMAQIDKVS